jgi:hypothetical protein
VSLIHAAEQDEAEKEFIKLKLIEEKQKVEQELTTLTNTHIMNTVNQEIEELIFYVKQRLLLRFNDFFKESFHPGVFNQNKNTQLALQSCLTELIRTVEFELVQELQATTLRVERFIQKVIADEFIRITQLIKKQSHSVTLTNPETKEIQTPLITVEFSSDMVSNLNLSLKLFKNAKAFFEKNEKKTMSEDLLKRIDVPVSITLEQYLNEFTNYYKEVIENIHSSLVQATRVQTEEGFDALLDIQAEDTGQLKQLQVTLESTINLLNG